MKPRRLDALPKRWEPERSAEPADAQVANLRDALEGTVDMDDAEPVVERGLGDEPRLPETR
jgi:hypothetical protein